jgi:drug/metabolite transporter (DMT)-like permease
MLAVVGLLLIVHMLSKIRLDDRFEDVNVWQVFPLAVLWSTLGIMLVIFNKVIFLQAGHGFDFPYTTFLMWWHMLSGTISTNCLRFARPEMMPAVTEGKLSLQSWAVNIVPIASLQALALALGNTAYLHISVAYIQMVKNTTSAFVFMFSIFLGLETATISTSFAVAMVVFGLLLTTAGEFDFSLLGFMFQMGGTLSDSLRLVLTKLVLSSNHVVKLDPLSALYFSSPTMLVILTVPMLLIDAREMTFEKVWNVKFVLVCNSLLAFGLNMTSMFFMKMCGATTYALTGVLKDVALILLCCAFFGHPMSGAQFSGFLISLIGFQFYNQLKSDQDYLCKIWNRLQGNKLDGNKEEESIDEVAPLLSGRGFPIQKGCSMLSSALVPCKEP